MDKAWERALPQAIPMTRKVARRSIAAALSARSLRWKRLRQAGKLALDFTLDNDRNLRHLNKRYRGKDKPTNVLSFTTFDEDVFVKDVPSNYPWILGDVVLALETIKREAKEQNKNLSQHYCHMIVHGVLHLFGFDHEKDRDARVMEKLEREILAGLGLPDPYA